MDINCYLRLADENDMDLLFRWANDAEVRKNSFSTDLISHEEHVKWYKKLLGNPNCKQYILVVGEEAVGQIRLTVEENVAEVSYSICQEKRCMGYGKLMLQLLTKQVQADFPMVHKLVAKVKPDNIASQKAFFNVGYIEKYNVFEMDIVVKDDVRIDIV